VRHFLDVVLVGLIENTTILPKLDKSIGEMAIALQ
jgi:hypothetical protein